MLLFKRVVSRVFPLFVPLLIAELGLTPSARAAVQCHGMRLPARTEVAGRTLILNGIGLRQATMLKLNVYVAGLYLPAPTHDGASVLQDMSTMRFVITLLRDARRGEMTHALRNGLERNAAGTMPTIEGRAAQLEQLIPDLRAGDNIVFTYRPEGAGVLYMELNGQYRGAIVGRDFARAFFAIWLNEPPSDNLKRGLLGGPCR